MDGKCRRMEGIALQRQKASPYLYNILKTNKETLGFYPESHRKNLTYETLVISFDLLDI